MKRFIAIVVALVFCYPFTSCSGLGGLAGTASKMSQGGLSQTEIASGLKEALSVGVGIGVKVLSARNGYYDDLAVRIGLPSEAAVITKNIAKLPGGQNLVTNTIQRINAAASDAVVNATPIFTSAIKSMTISDATNILRGNKTAATTYFKGKTKTGLKKLFSTYIEDSTNKKIIGDISCNSSWNTLTSKWNTVAATPVAKAAGLHTVKTDLNDFLTDKAVDGLYVKIGEQEANIRSNASARTSALLKKVFANQR